MGDRPGRGLAYTGSRPSARETRQRRPARPRRVGTPPAGTAQNPGKPDAGQPAVVPGTTGHMIPTPGIGQPDGRKGIQDQVTPIGRGGRRLPR